MKNPMVGDKFVVLVEMLAVGEDGKLCITISHPLMENKPTFVMLEPSHTTFDQFQGARSRRGEEATF